MSTGSIKLNRYNGSEIFPFSVAKVRVWQFEDAHTLDFEFETLPYVERSDSLEQIPEEKTLSGEIKIILPGKFSLGAVANKKFEVPKSYDEALDEYVTSLYYYEHEGLDDNSVEILNIDDDSFRVRWEATACDPNFYDGSKPRTKVLIEGKFLWGGITKQAGTLISEE